MTEFYRYLHRGHCNDDNAHVVHCTSHISSKHCISVEATVMDCRNRCERLGKNIGYFTYVPGAWGSTCACYTKCENDGKFLDHIAFQIMRPGNLKLFS